ncbi:MAG: hypothetical protein K9H16_01175 [Bacteroidales bacterium]|nr:hypothetical protein [Bacteroidales bacterium]
MRITGLFSALFVSIQFFAQSQILNLSDPSQFHDGEFSISGNDKSSHYHQPLIINFYNKSDEIKTLQIDPGQKLIATEASYQNFVVTKKEVITLAPNATESLELHAMCIERFDYAPGASAQYNPGAKADSGLMLLCEKINTEKLFNYEAQTAVWAMVGDIGLESIAGFDTTLVNDLVALVAKVRGEEPPPPPSPDDYHRNYYTSGYSYKLKMGGEFSYGLFEKSEIIIAMFDKNNISVRELYKNESCPPGHHDRNFSFDATEYTDDFYYVRLIENGEIMLEIEVKTPERARRS